VPRPAKGGGFRPLAWTVALCAMTGSVTSNVTGVDGTSAKDAARTAFGHGALERAARYPGSSVPSSPPAAFAAGSCDVKLGNVNAPPTPQGASSAAKRAKSARRGCPDPVTLRRTGDVGQGAPRISAPVSHGRPPTTSGSPPLPSQSGP
jgi:hypothetical protein